MLKIQIEVSSKDIKIFNGLRASINRGSIDIFKLKLTPKNVDVKNINGGTLLMEAVYLNQLEFVQELINMGAYLDAQDDKGWTVLMYAVYAKNIEMVKFLVENNASLSLQDVYKRTAFDHAKEYKYYDIGLFLGDKMLEGKKKGVQHKDIFTIQKFQSNYR